MPKKIVWNLKDLKEKSFFNICKIQAGDWWYHCNSERNMIRLKLAILKVHNNNIILQKKITSKES